MFSTYLDDNSKISPDTNNNLVANVKKAATDREMVTHSLKESRTKIKYVSNEPKQIKSKIHELNIPINKIASNIQQSDCGISYSKDNIVLRTISPPLTANTKNMMHEKANNFRKQNFDVSPAISLNKSQNNSSMSNINKKMNDYGQDQLIVNIVEQALNKPENNKSTSKFEQPNDFLMYPSLQEPSFSKHESFIYSKRDNIRKSNGNENANGKKVRAKDEADTKLNHGSSVHMQECNDISLIPVKLNNSLLSVDDNKTERMNNSNITNNNIKHNEFILDHMKCERQGLSQLNRNNGNNYHHNNKFILEEIKDKRTNNQQEHVLQPRELNMDRIDSTVKHSSTSKERNYNKSTDSSVAKFNKNYPTSCDYIANSEDKENEPNSNTKYSNTKYSKNIATNVNYKKMEINVVDENYSLKKQPSNITSKYTKDSTPENSLLNNRNYIENLRRRVKKRLEDEFENYENSLQDKGCPINRISKSTNNM